MKKLREAGVTKSRDTVQSMFRTLKSKYMRYSDHNKQTGE